MLSSILELDFMQKEDTPIAKLSCLLATARSIYNTVNFNRRRKKVALGFLGADDFLPIFICNVASLFRDLVDVVAHSHLDMMETLSEYLYAVCDPSQLNGEGGFYLTVFNSALQFIKGMDTSSLTAPEASEESSFLSQSFRTSPRERRRLDFYSSI